MSDESREKILIVDDNPANIEVLGGILFPEYEVMVATNGEQALNIAFSEQPPALILLDIMMPVMDGYEVCRRLKKDPVACRIPIIMVSAKSQEDDETYGFQLGVADYIKKPVNAAVTMARVKTQLMLKTYRDHLERQLRKTENDRQRQQQYFAKLFYHSPQAIAYVDLQNQIRDVNPAFSRLFAYQADEVIGQKMETLIVPEKNRGEHRKLFQQIFNGHHEKIETVRSRRDGRMIPVSIFGYRVDAELEFDGCFIIYEDISERKSFEKELRYRAFHDSLTGLANRVLLMERVERALKRKRRLADYHFAVLMIDLDRFKSVNDSLGHAAGDFLLKEIARRLAGGVRDGDTVARLGGDEFAVLLEDVADHREVCQVVCRIQQRLEEEVLVEQNELHVSSSIGIVWHMERYQQADDIFRDADLAMYSANDSGRANYKFFDETLYQKALEQALLEKDLRHALERSELELYYQPIMSLNNKEISGFEALLRWRHPKQGMIAPDRFIPLAEETGLIVPIGSWVLAEACQQLKEWQQQKTEQPNLTMNVNVSVKQFLQIGFVDEVKTCLMELALNPADLKLELTESLLMDHSKSALAKIEELKALGIQFVIDDFGTGYSSLSYIHRFPVDVLKIDRSFVSNLESGRECTEIIRSIMEMSRHLGMSVVAEGIESKFQLEVLEELSCDNVQGYLISRPLGKKQATQLIRPASCA